MPDLASLALARATRVPYAFRKFLIDRVGTAATLLRDSADTLGLEPRYFDSLKKLRKEADLKEAERALKQLERMSAWVLSYDEPRYPKLLKEIPDPPLVLFGKGRLPPEEEILLGFVGPRKPSAYGARVAKLLAEDLVREKIGLVSGLARGIDAIAHESAVRGKGTTIAVMACGIDRVYPPEHAHLKEKVADCGAVVTEFFPGEPPRPEQFPRRNRIIAGLSRGVLLVEAGEKSGARTTARHAIEQSREVFAVPGPIDSPLSFWPNRLISDGAKLVATSDDILEEIVPNYQRATEKAAHSTKTEEISEEARQVLDRLTWDEPMGIDEIVGAEESSVQMVMSALLELELCGLLEKRADARYVRVGVRDN